MGDAELVEHSLMFDHAALQRQDTDDGAAGGEVPVSQCSLPASPSTRA